MSTQLSIQTTLPARPTGTHRVQLAVQLRRFAQRDFAQRDHRQMPTPLEAFDDQLELCNTPSRRPGPSRANGYRGLTSTGTAARIAIFSVRKKRSMIDGGSAVGALTLLQSFEYGNDSTTI